MKDWERNQPDFPAHPVTNPDVIYWGITVREHFAGQALIGLSGMLNKLTHLQGQTPEQAADQLARICYQLADAMIRVGKEGAQ